MLETDAFDFEMAIENLESHKSSGIDQIPAELIKAGSTTICYEIHKLIISLWNREELPEEWRESIVVPTYKKDDKTDCTRVVPKVMSKFFFLHANWEQQTKKSMVVDGTSCCVILECLVTSIACIT